MHFFHHFAIASAITLLTACGIAPRPGSTVLAPTPVAVLEGVPQPVDALEKSTLKSDIPVFIVSGRILEDRLKRRVDPFGNTRSKQPNPHLAIATVRIGEDLSAEQIYRETVSDVSQKKTKFQVSDVSVSPGFSNYDPWKIKAYKKEKTDNAWLKAIRR